MSVTHAEFTIERQYHCTPSQTFSAFADPELKARWFAVPERFENRVWELDFRVGGGEVNSGGPAGGAVPHLPQPLPRHRRRRADRLRLRPAPRRPPDVASPDHDRALPRRSGTRLVFTEQGAFFDGLDDPAEREHGTGKLLDALGALPRRGASRDDPDPPRHPFASYCWKALIAFTSATCPSSRNQIDDERRPRPAGRALAAGGDAACSWTTTPGSTLPESTIVVEYLDRFGDAPPLIPADPDAALQARLWDRVIDGRVKTPMQKIVLDNLRPEGDRRPPRGRGGPRRARPRLPVLDEQLRGNAWLAGPDFTLADCAAAPALLYARAVRRWDEDGLADLTRTTQPSWPGRRSPGSSTRRGRSAVLPAPLARLRRLSRVAPPR